MVSFLLIFFCFNVYAAAPASFEELKYFNKINKSFNIKNSNYTNYVKTNKGIKSIGKSDYERPDEYYEPAYVFKVLKDENNKVVFVSNSPISGSGDWSEVSEYYFDLNGRLRILRISKASFNKGAETIDGNEVGTIDLYSYFNAKGVLVSENIRTNLKAYKNKKGIHKQFKEYLYFSLKDFVKKNELQKIINVK